MEVTNASLALLDIIWTLVMAALSVRIQYRIALVVFRHKIQTEWHVRLVIQDTY